MDPTCELNLTLVLASRSPRRARLLREAGLVFRAFEPPFADPAQPEVDDPGALATRLAQEKAASLALDPALDSHLPAMVLGADTIVVSPDGQLLGQPIDRDDAAAMLALLLGRQHQVITGVALLKALPARPSARLRFVEAFHEAAFVTFGEISDAERRRYLDSGEWAGKAGAYNFAELEQRWPITVEGDPTTVVGLPMTQLLPALAEHGFRPSHASRQA